MRHIVLALTIPMLWAIGAAVTYGAYLLGDTTQLKDLGAVLGMFVGAILGIGCLLWTENLITALVYQTGRRNDAEIAALRADAGLPPEEETEEDGDEDA